MKAIILTSLLIATSAYAKIGWTLDECRAEYGNQVKPTTTAWCGGTAHAFTHDGLYIYAIIPEGGSVVTDISYFDNVTGLPLTQSKKESLWLQNQTKRWDSGSVRDWLNYNGPKEYNKGLGLERGYKHIVQFSRDTKYANVGNDKREKGGYQVRTLKQFYAEQKVIKAILKNQKNS